MHVLTMDSNTFTGKCRSNSRDTYVTNKTSFRTQPHVQNRGALETPTTMVRFGTATQFWCACGTLFLSVALSAVSAETLTSTTCPSLRWAPYPARLDLYYFYLIEFRNDTTPDLDGIARALAVNLIDTFHGCNAFGVPVHGVQLERYSHRYSSGGELPYSLFAAVSISVYGSLTHPSVYTPQDPACVGR